MVKVVLPEGCPTFEDLLKKRAPVRLELVIPFGVSTLKVERFERVHVVVERLVMIKAEPD